MKSLFFTTTFLIALVMITPVCAKRPPKPPRPPKQPKPALSQEQKQAIVSNVAQVMGGVCTIVQDPHNHHNIGTSVATMIHGLINIIVEKIAHKKIDCNDQLELEEYINELCEDMSKEIVEIVTKQKLLYE